MGLKGCASKCCELIKVILFSVFIGVIAGGVVSFFQGRPLIVLQGSSIQHGDENSKLNLVFQNKGQGDAVKVDLIFAHSIEADNFFEYSGKDVKEVDRVDGLTGFSYPYSKLPSGKGKFVVFISLRYNDECWLREKVSRLFGQKYGLDLWATYDLESKHLNYATTEEYKALQDKLRRRD